MKEWSEVFEDADTKKTSHPIEQIESRTLVVEVNIILIQIQILMHNSIENIEA